MKTRGRFVTRRQFLGTTTAAALGALAENRPAASAGDSASSMKYRRLGRTNLMISEIGLGCASGLRSQQLGPELFNRYREELPAITHKLLELGGNFVATSASYHDTEEILGRALKGRRKDVFIFTASGKKDAKAVIADCERSLQRFQTDVLDGYFAHGGWSEGFQEAAAKLKQQGKIRFIGMSCHVPEKHRERIEANQVDFILQPYNYMNLAKWTEKTDRVGTEELFELCRKKDVGVMVIKPMTGHFIPNWAKKTDDPKVAWLLKELKVSGKQNLYQAFLMWVLKNPNVSCAIVGMGAVQDVVEDCAAVTKKLTASHERLLEQYAALATGDYCRMCETCVPNCPAGVRIPDILRFRMYYQNYGHRRDARELYASLASHQQASACTGCGRCEQTCPSRLAIVQKLKAAHALLA
ncbi:MAG: aldo/keto reductase [Verrucomicrobiae bacterium]|nr:aldo/keto reductase [Verrucomicrobiae bacterium]